MLPASSFCELSTGVAEMCLRASMYVQRICEAVHAIVHETSLGSIAYLVEP